MDIENSVQGAFDGFFAYLPNILGFLVLLIVGYIVAKVVQVVARKVLQKMGLDRRLHESDASKYVDRFMPGASPSNGIARLLFWMVFAFFVVAAIGALQIAAVTDFANQVLAYIPNVIAAILIFVVAALISGAVVAGVTRVMGDTPTGKIVATVLPALVMVIAFFMILEQLQIAPEIIRIAFAATMGALALGLALAFGLGGRGVAERMLEDAYSKGREQSEQVKRDLQTGRARTEAQAREAQARMEGETTTTQPMAPASTGAPSTGYRTTGTSGTTGTGTTGTGTTGTTGTGYPQTGTTGTTGTPGTPPPPPRPGSSYGEGTTGDTGYPPR